MENNEYINAPRWNLIKTVCSEIDAILNHHIKTDEINFLEMGIIIMIIKDKTDQEKYMYCTSFEDENKKKIGERNPDFYK